MDLFSPSFSLPIPSDSQPTQAVGRDGKRVSAAPALDYRNRPSSGGAGGGYERDPDDFYVEPEWCVELLLEAEPFAGVTLDPACGSGTIPKVFRARGLTCLASDLADRGFGAGGADFLAGHTPFAGPFDNIVTNPPYGRGVKAAAFIERALQVARAKAAFLVNEKFLYAERRHGLFTASWPGQQPAGARGLTGQDAKTTFSMARIYFLSSRPSMPPGAMLAAGTIEAKGGAMNYCWLVWARAHVGPPTAHWLIRSKA